MRSVTLPECYDICLNMLSKESGLSSEDDEDEDEVPGVRSLILSFSRVASLTLTFGYVSRLRLSFSVMMKTMKMIKMIRTMLMMPKQPRSRICSEMLERRRL